MNSSRVPNSYMREVVMNAYPGEKWATKVAHMPFNQVKAIYMRITYPGIKRKKKKQDKNLYSDGSRQLTLLDFGFKY